MKELASPAFEAAGHVLRSLKAANTPLLVVADREWGLTELLGSAYAKHGAECQWWDSTDAERVLEQLHDLPRGSRVILVQSGAFRLSGYRDRLLIFNLGLRSAEHRALQLIPESQWHTYLKALCWDPHGEEAAKGRRLQTLLAETSRVTVTCPGTTLRYDGPMEPALLNLADYPDEGPAGGTFPVGEIFSEPKDLSCVSGSVKVIAFPSIERRIEVVEPFKVTIEKGILTDWSNAPSSFREVIEIIREREGEIQVREFGMGLNKHISPSFPLADVTAFERQEGLHLSLGKKHTVFKKPSVPQKKARFHIDVFLDVEEIQFDENPIYRKGQGFLV